MSAIITRSPDPRVGEVHTEGETLRHGEQCDGCGYGSQTSQNGHGRGCRIGCPTKTAAQWAADNGRGFLCSTEW